MGFVDPFAVASVESPEEFSRWARSLNDECRAARRVVLPLADAESEFPERLLDHGEIVPALLTNDSALGERIAAQPMLAWKAVECPPAQGQQVVKLIRFSGRFMAWVSCSVPGGACVTP